MVHGIFDGLNDFFNGVDMDDVCFIINLGKQVLGRAELFASSHKHRVLNRSDEDLRVDAFFLAQNFNRLKDRCQSVCPLSTVLFGCITRLQLPLELQIRFFDLIERELYRFACRRLKRDHISFQCG